MPHSLYWWVRVFAAMATLFSCVMAHRRMRDPYATVFTAAFAVTYLMLFNPRTQSTTYSIVGCLAAVLAAVCALDGRRKLAAAITVIVLAWTVNAHTFHFIEFWLKPLACVFFAVLLMQELVRPSRTTVLANPGSGEINARELR
jgi:hypothetical protein